MARLVKGGGRCQNAQKQNIIKTYKELILYKSVGKYQFSMPCIRDFVIIMCQVIICLISQLKHMLSVPNRTATTRRFFKAPNYRLNLMGKKICASLHSKTVFI